MIGHEVERCDRIPTWMPDWSSNQLGYERGTGKIRMFAGDEARMDYARGWVELGLVPTLDAVTASMADTYLESIGRKGDLVFWCTIANRLREWNGVIGGEPDAIIFGNKENEMDFAVRQPSGDYFAKEGNMVVPEFGIPIRLYK